METESYVRQPEEGRRARLGNFLATLYSAPRGMVSSFIDLAHAIPVLKEEMDRARAETIQQLGVEEAWRQTFKPSDPTY